MAVNDVWEAQVFQNVGSEVTMNVLHLREVVGESVLTIPARGVAAAVHDIFLGVAADLSEDWRVTQIHVRRVFPTPDVPFTRVLGAGDGIVGTVVSEIVPSAAAGLISLYSMNPSRAGRGRIFLPGIPELHQNEGQFTEAAHTNLQTWADNFLTVEIGPYLTGTAHYWLTVFNEGSAAPSVDQDVVAATVRSNLATQRRRRAFPGFAT